MTAGARMRTARALVVPGLLAPSLLCLAMLAHGGARAAEPVSSSDHAALQAEVANTERAFAKTMADRDFTKFVSFVSSEAVFFSGDKPLRGRAAVAAAWKRFFAADAAPFSWEPAQVEVLNSGTLALSSGPVHDPSGKVIGSFTSTWRRDAPGVWHIVFDKGCDVCAACQQ